MGALKYWDGAAWQYASIGQAGPEGPPGPTGPAGADGADGDDGIGNLSWDAATSTVATDTGVDAVLTIVDATNAGLMSVAQRDILLGALQKLAGGASVENVGAIESKVSVIAATGATETLDTSLFGIFDCTMDMACTFTFSNPAPSGECTMFTLILRGAFTPTWPATVDWPDATLPTYTTPAAYTFMTVDGGTTWLGSQAGKAFG